MNASSLILDRYRPLEEAGSGGFGTVFKAWDTRIQRYVAIKTIALSEHDAARAAANAAAAENLADQRLERESTSEATASLPNTENSPSPSISPSISPSTSPNTSPSTPDHSLAHLPGLDEARTAAMMQDQHIVAVYDFEIRGTTAYLIMEYVEGLSLAHLLRNYDDQLTLNQIATIFSGVAHALSVAHANGVLHLDIKPDNVLIDTKGMVKVTDFGLATLADASGVGFAGGGTIGYMPPEQIDRAPLDERCDEWALAAMSYEMLVGTNPFRVRSFDQAKAAIVDAELVVPSLCWDELPETADDVLFDALDPDREERFETVSAFAQEFQPYLGDETRGREELAAIVNHGNFDELAEDDALSPEADVLHRRSLFSRIAAAGKAGQSPLSPCARSLCAHAIGGLGSALVGVLAFTNMPPLVGDGISSLGTFLEHSATLYDQAPFWILLFATAIIGAIKPAWGALASFEAFGVALIMQQQSVLGAIFMAITALWFFFLPRGLRGHRARIANNSANVAFTPALAGALSCSAITPFAAGLSLSPLRAAIASTYGSVVALVLAACGSQSILGWDALRFGGVVTLAGAQETALYLLQDPSFWCIATSWFVATFILSALRAQHSRVFSLLGGIVASVLLCAGLLAANVTTNGSGSMSPGIIDCVLTGAIIVVGIACCSFVSATSEWE